MISDQEDSGKLLKPCMIFYSVSGEFSVKPHKEPELDQLKSLIRAKYVELLPLRSSLKEKGYFLFVDEEGALNGKLPNVCLRLYMPPEVFAYYHYTNGGPLGNGVLICPEGSTPIEDIQKVFQEYLEELSPESQEVAKESLNMLFNRLKVMLQKEIKRQEE